MSEKLKPCPFCGGRGKLRRWHGFMFFVFLHGRTYYSVRCNSCDCETVSSTDRQFVIDRWNRRTEVTDDA